MWSVVLSSSVIAITESYIRTFLFPQRVSVDTHLQLFAILCPFLSPLWVYLMSVPPLGQEFPKEARWEFQAIALRPSGKMKH